LPNLWIGTTVENQKVAVKRIPELLKIRATVRFISVEPMLGPMNISNFSGIDWVICGGETGPGARKMQTSWVLSLLEQCKYMKIPFFFKKWGSAWKDVDQEKIDGKILMEFPK